MSNSKKFTYLLVAGILLLLFYFFFIKDRSNAIFGTSELPNDPLASCISWRDAGQHDGEDVCIIGRILFVNVTYDSLSGQNIWGARFSNDESSLRLVSVEESLEEWKNKCVVINGTLRDRSKEDPEFRDGPWMINSEFGYDFRIQEIFEKYCE